MSKWPYLGPATNVQNIQIFGMTASIHEVVATFKMPGHDVSRSMRPHFGLIGLHVPCFLDPRFFSQTFRRRISTHESCGSFFSIISFLKALLKTHIIVPGRALRLRRRQICWRAADASLVCLTILLHFHALHDWLFAVRVQIGNKR